MKKKYMVFSNEVVFYITEVEAESEQDAIDKVIGGEVEIGDAVDGDNFQIEYAQCIEE